MSLVQLDPKTAPPFPEAAKSDLRDTQLRRNVARATDTIQRKRAALVEEKKDWQALRDAGPRSGSEALANLDRYLLQFEERFQAAGGTVHWAVNAAEANRIVLGILRESAAREVIKIKSMTTAEIGLNEFLAQHGVTAHETDLAELILQLGGDQPSHIVVPALHKNRQQVREIFAHSMNLPDLSDDPQALTAAARQYLREKFLRVKTAICGANFLIAETGGITIVESEGNGRMCLTLPETLIAIVGIEKVIPRFADLEVLPATLPRSATGERMNPYNSIWSGVLPGDGPKQHARRAARQRPQPRSARRHRPRRRCNAFAAEPARTPAPSTGRPAAMPTARSMPAPSARSSRRSLKTCDTRSRCRTRRRSAAPATKSARSRSISRRCWSTCVRASWIAIAASWPRSSIRNAPECWPWPRSSRTAADTKPHSAWRAPRRAPSIAATPGIAGCPAWPGDGPRRATWQPLPRQTFREWWQQRGQQ